MDFRASLEALGIYSGQDTDWDAFQDAVEQAYLQDDLRHEEVITFFRHSTSPHGGDEIETAGIFSSPRSNQPCFYWCDMAGGMVEVAFPTSEGKAGIGPWISNLLASRGYSFYQFKGCDITNHAPRLLNRQQVWSMVEAAFQRGGSMDDLEEEQSLTQWFEEHYAEEAP